MEVRKTRDRKAQRMEGSSELRPAKPRPQSDVRKEGRRSKGGGGKAIKQKRRLHREMHKKQPKKPYQ